MTRASVLVAVIVGISLISMGYAVYTFYFSKNYTVYANVTCDPALYSCFLGDGEELPEFYAEVSRIANTIPACDAWNDECPELSCAEGDDSCTITYCEPDEETTCSDQHTVSD